MLRGFNMELNNTSAQRVNDVYSNLAANAAANTQEIADAMTRTASIANAAGMEFETTAAFLTQMIETTRESAENLGTAMKTIVARFTEMKKSPNEIIDVEGEEVSANKVEAALKSVGVQLRGTNGEFRDLDDVFLDLSSKWDSLDKMSQRYVATTAAGSRQQSRFIAMMDNYQRTMELVGYATNSAGASQRQFEKTMDSLESKLNRLHNAWEQFTTGLANQSIIKGIVDLLTGLLDTVNNITGALDPLNTGWSKLLVTILGFKAAKGIVDKVLQGVGSQMTTGAGVGGNDSKEPTKKKENIFQRTKNALFDRKKDLTEEEEKAIQKELEENEKNTKELEKQVVATQQKAKNAREAADAAKEEADAEKRKVQQAHKARQTATNRVKDAEDADRYVGEIDRNKSKTQYNLNKAQENRDVVFQQTAEELEELGPKVAEKNAIAIEGETKARQAEIEAEKTQAALKDSLQQKSDIENKTIKMGLITKAKNYAMLLFGNAETRKAALETLQKAGAMGADAAATGVATGAQSALNAAMMACPVGWILAAIAAIVAAVAIFAAVHETTSEKVERLSKTVGELGAQMNETQETINDLKSSWENLQGLEDELNNLTEGTVEWKQKLVEVNQEVLNLIDKYPKLAQYVSNDNGQLKISSSGYDVFLNEQLESLQMQQQSFAFGQSLLADMQKQELSEKNTSTFKQSQTKKQQMDSKEIERDNYFASGISNLASNYIEEQEKIGNKLTEEEKDLLATVSANKQSLKNFEKIKKETDADVGEYARLTGLTKEQVEAKKEQKELNNDAIQTLIATNKYQEKYKEQAENLVRLTKTTKLKDVEKRAISGANSFTSNDLGNNNVQEIFSKYLKDGIATIEEDDFDNIREILTQNFGFDSGTLQSLEECGASLEGIVQNLVDSESSLDHYEENLKQLGYTNNRILTDFINNIQDNLDKELSTEQLKQVSDLFVDIKSQGGDIQGFSDSLKKIISSIKNPKDLEQFLNILKNVDFSSETAIRTFSDELSTLGVNLGENVTTQLAKASNAAEDFDLSQLTSQLRNFELADKVKAKREGSDKAFNETDYNAITKDLQKKGEQELIDQFTHRGSNYVFTGDWDKLIDALQGDLTFVEKKKQRQKTQKEYEDNQKEYVELLGNSKATDYAPEERNRKTIWDYDKKWNYSYANESSYTFDFKNPGELESDYLNSLLYVYDDDGQILAGDSGEALFDWGKISDILLNATTDSKFAKAIPKEFYTKVIERIDANNKDDMYSGSAMQDSLRSLAKLIGYEYEEYVGYTSEELHNKINDYTKSNEGWKNTQLKANEEFLQPYLDKGLITQDEFDEMSKKTREEIQTWIQSLDFSELYNKLYDETAEEEKGQYIGIDSAQKIIDKTATTTEGFEAQKEAIDAIVHSCDGYKERLKDIQKQYNINEEAAKQVLAVEIERENATKEIASVLSSNEKILDKDNLNYSKNTGEYYAAMDTLVEKFKVLFGDNITQEWVEKNLETIKKLSKGGKEAQDAMDALSATAEVSKATIFQANSGKAGGEKSETVFDAIQANIKKATKDIKSKTSEVEGYFASIKKELDNLDGSDATIEVKENTRAAVMDELKNSIYALIAQKVMTKDPSEKNAIQSKINLIKSLASDIGFAISVPDDSNVSADNEFATWKSRGLTDKEAEIQAQESIKSQLKGLKKGITVIDTQGTTVELNNPYGGNGDGKEDKDSSSKKEWTNDWDRQYAVLKKIESLERERNSLSKEQQRFLKTGLLNEKKILKTKEDQRRNLTQQVKLNEDLVKDADAWLRGMNNDGRFDGVIWWDDEYKTIRTDDAYIRSMDEDTKKEFDKVKADYEHYYSQRNTADSNIDAAIDAIEELTSSISELDFHSTTEKLIAVIDNVIDLYDKAEKRLEWSERNVNSKDIVNLYDAKGKELIEKSKALTTDFIQTEATINTLLNKPEYKKYYNYDWKTGKVTTTGAYDAIVDSDIKSNVKDFIDKLNTYSQQRASDDSERIDIQDTLREMEQAILTKAESFRKNVYDAIVNQREEEISRLENINSSIQSAAADLVSSIQKNIQKIRQDRNNKKTEEELTKLQNRLTYLQMDTSGGNQKTILDLEKQLEEKEQSYTDTLIDQKISELQDQNTEAEKQRKQQIEVMKTQLEVQKDNGLIWSDVRYLIANGLSASGKIKEGSELDTALKSWGKYSSLSEQGKKDWLHEQNLGASNFDAYYSQGLNNRDYDQKVDYSANGADKSYDVIKQQMINAYKQGLIESINNTTPYRDYMRYDSKNNKLIQTKLFPHPDDDKALNSTLQNAWDQAWSTINTIYNLDSYFEANSGKNIVFTHVPNIARYATGGLADYTGPAWLDGTPSSPELVLNQRDTKNFIQLKDILSSVMNDTSTQTKPNGDYYFEIAINVDKITSDYDVDQIADRIKQQISDSARYRNVNVINLLR